MAFSITETPGLVTPAYSPMYYNVYENGVVQTGFRFTSDLTILGARQKGPVFPSPTGNLYVSSETSNFIKQRTNGDSQFWDPSRVAQTFLTFNFSADTHCIIPSGQNTIARVSNTLSYETNVIDKVDNEVTFTNYIFNGGEDRNKFETPATDPNFFYNYLPQQIEPEKAKFLTHFNTRTVDLEDTGSLASLNGRFDAKVAYDGAVIPLLSRYVSNDSYDYTTFNNGAIVNKYMLANPYKDAYNVHPTYGIDTSENRVTIPAYPKNITANAPWAFFDNLFNSGRVGFVSPYPHNLKVGDSVYVYQDPGFFNPEYNGYHTVTKILNAYEIVIDVSWGIGTPAQGGSIVKVLPAGCSISLVDDTIINITSVVNNGGKAEFVFAGVDVGNVKPNSEIYAQTSVYGILGLSTNEYVQPVLNNVLPTGQTINSVLSDINFISTDTGPALIRERMPNATQPFFSNIAGTKVDSYEIKFSQLDPLTQVYFPFGTAQTFNIACRCTDDRVELTWLNKLGAFDSMLFQGRNTKSVEFSKENYTRRLGDFLNAPNGAVYNIIGYNNTDFERQSFNGYQTTSFTVSTGWISEMEGDRVIECMGSNVVFMYVDGVYTPVFTTVEDVQVKTKANNKLVFYTISLELTYNTVSQRR